MTVLVMISALVLDWLLGEPRRWHPLVGFGHIASFIEHRFNQPRHSPRRQIFNGMAALLISVVPCMLITGIVCEFMPWGEVVSVLVLFLCIGHRSLYQHAQPIMTAMQQGDEKQARELAGRIVSRDKDQLDIAKATVESVLENGNDAIFGALFWFVIAGAPGAVAYRLINTLDAMWGYRTPRFLYFGRVAARSDDLLNYIPARLTAVSYALLGHTRKALKSWHRQAPLWDSPNAGPVMAAGAGALDIQLGGKACYRGVWHQRPVLGTLRRPQAEDINRALHMVSLTVLLWLLVFMIIFEVFYA